MRGYARLKREGRVIWMREVKNRLVDQPVLPAQAGASRLVFGAAHGQAERVVRQFMLERYAGTPFYRAVLRSMGEHDAPLAYPMPGAWRAFLGRQGIVFSDWRASFAWHRVVLLRFAAGVVAMARLAARILANALHGPRAPSPGRFVYFYALSRLNVPKPGATAPSRDICSWYLASTGRAAALDAVCHGVADAPPVTSGGVEIAYRPPPYGAPDDLKSAALFILWGAGACTLALLGLLRGQWANALMLAEAAKAKAVRLCPGDRLGIEYFFPFSGSIYRPMWTYELQDRGIGVTLYFYSTYEQPQAPHGPEAQKFEWGPANWPAYMVWDAYQAENLRRDLGDALVTKTVGPIHFSDSGAPMPDVPRNSIAVFDVEPHRKSLVFGMTTLVDYLHAHPDAFVRFLEDLSGAIEASGATMILKAKRVIGERGERRYRHVVERISASRSARVIDPGISAVRVIEACRAGVSIPFTSTALYLREQGLPSVYYDPTGWIRKDDKGAHGIPILSGKAELLAWLRMVLAAPEAGGPVGSHPRGDGDSAALRPPGGTPG